MTQDLTSSESPLFRFAQPPVIEPEPAPKGPAVMLDFDESAYRDPEPAPATVSTEIEPEPAPEPEPEAAKVPEPLVVSGPVSTKRRRAKSTRELEKVYSSSEVAAFFDKSTQWLYWGMRDKDAQGNPVQPVFVYEDGTPIEPTHQVGKGRRRRYKLPEITEMAYACYRRGNLKEDGLKRVLGRIEAAKRGQFIPTPQKSKRG